MPRINKGAWVIIGLFLSHKRFEYHFQVSFWHISLIIKYILINIYINIGLRVKYSPEKDLN